MTWTQAAFGRATLALTAFGFVILLAIAASTVWMVQQTRLYAADVVAIQQIRVTVSEVFGALQDAETGLRGFLLTGDSEYLAPYHAAFLALAKSTPALTERIIASHGDASVLAGLQQAIAAKMGELADTVALARAGEQHAAVEAVRAGRGMQVMNQIRARLAAIEQLSEDRQAARSADLERSGRLLLIGALGGLALLALLAVASVAIAMRYTRELASAQTALQGANASLERRVATRTESLMEANEEIQRFAYIVSHDLRAPLVNVMGFTQELETAIETVRETITRAEAEAPQLVTQTLREAVDEDIPEAIGFIRSSTNRMDRLIGAILTLSREGRRRLQAETVPVQALVEALAASMAHQLDAAGAELRLQAPFPTLRTDRLALEQILGNLLDNAVKYLAADRPGRILLRARRESGMNAFDVVDNGRGIAARDHDRVFELFRRSGPQDQKGEGIGLAHVRTLARRMGGDIRLTSQLGEGSVFTLLLPDALPILDATLESDPELNPA